MTRQEFLSQLRDALKDDLSAGAVEEQVNYYNSYISEEVRNGKSEEEVLEMLGDPWILARTITDAADGTDQQTAYGYDYDAGSQARSSGGQQNYGNGGMHEVRFDTWWKKLLLILVIVMVVLLVVAVVTGLIRILAPILVPVLVIMIVVRLIGGRRS